MARPLAPNVAGSRSVPPDVDPDGPAPYGWRWTRRGRLRRRNIVWRARKAIVSLVVFAILGVSGAGYAYWVRTPIPEVADPVESSFICTGEVPTDCNQANAIAQVGGEGRVLVRYQEIPKVFIQALVAAEDKDFFNHQGVDPAGVARALWRDIRSGGAGGLQGGSTITQQYVKNAYLKNEQTLSRKIQEAVIAVKLDSKYSKPDILERYLNTIFFGRSAFGIEAASQAYFGKHVSQLDLRDSAYLAAVIREPELVDANRPTGDPLREKQRAYAIQRRKQVLDTMVEEGYVSRAEADEAAAADFESYVKVRPTNPGKRRLIEANAPADLQLGYWLDYVDQWIRRMNIIPEKRYEAGGLRIYTTLDKTAERQAYEAVTSVLNQPGVVDPLATLVSVDDQGFIRSMVGGYDYATKQFNAAYNNGKQGQGRQPGSSFKPIVLAGYLANGQGHLDDRYDSPSVIKAPIRMPDGTTLTNDIANDEPAQGNMDVVTATVESSNTAYLEIMKKVGIKPTLDMARKLGVHTELKSLWTNVLGESEVSTVDMAAAYSVFAARGLGLGEAAPFPVSKITDTRGKILWEAPIERSEVLKPEVADRVNYALGQVVADPRGTPQGSVSVPNQVVAGKTGTTKDSKDAWFVGYTCKLTTAVWMGYENPRKMENIAGFQGQMFGGKAPAKIFTNYMRAALAGKPTPSDPWCRFERPPDPVSNTGPSTTARKRSTTTQTTEADDVTTTSRDPNEETSTSRRRPGFPNPFTSTTGDRSTTTTTDEQNGESTTTTRRRGAGLLPPFIPGQAVGNN